MIKTASRSSAAGVRPSGPGGGDGRCPYYISLSLSLALSLSLYIYIYTLYNLQYTICITI